MNIAKFLLSLGNKYNGHYQTNIKGLTVKQGLKLCKELERHSGGKSSFVMEMWTDGGFTLYEKDGLGSCKDRIILTNGDE